MIYPAIDKATKHQCPVCEYPNLEENPLAWTFEICPCCGTEFGLDDYERTHAELRAEWIEAGRPWFDTSCAP